MNSLLGLTESELKSLAVSEGLPAFTGKQITEWLYQKGIGNFNLMSNLSKPARTLLQEKYSSGYNAPVSSQKSTDGTIKYLFAAGENKFIEAVYIPDEDRHTLCVSTQIGCARHCKFCLTGLMGLQGNLTTGEILNQIYSIPESQKLTNLVFMGMGEPMDNFESVIKTIDILTASYAKSWSPKRITVSTIGIPGGVKRFLELTTAHLAVSLHNPFPEERALMMPVEKRYPVATVIEMLRKAELKSQRKISFEYILFDGINDSQKHLDGLIKLLSGLKCRINLIRYHSIEGNNYKCSSAEVVEKFREGLLKKGFRVTVRKSRGEDISAACGMLSTKKQKG